ncbi:MAG: ComEC/Rec2 family competence protein [Thermodesulfobacteriota bacterium]
MAYKAHFINVGCADCTIFEIGNDLVMVDCGYRRFNNGASKPTSIYNYLKTVIGKTYIDLLIITHPHHDHYLGMEELIGKVTVAEFWGSPYQRRYGDNSLSADEWNEYSDLKNRLIPDSNTRFTCTKGTEKILSGCKFIVLGPSNHINKVETRECHDASLVVWVSSPANNFLICGDASDSELEQIRSEWNLSSCTVLRASHHGSENGAHLDFIKAVSPRDTIISTQSGIFSNVPSNTALQRYKNNSGKVFRTDVDGTCTTPLVAG